MKTVSTAFMNKMTENLRTWIPRMTINGTEVSGDIQPGLTINQGSCGAETFTIGVMYVPYITASVKDCTTVLQDKEIYLEMGLKLDDGTVEYAPVGYFTVAKPSVGKHLTSFTAYGRLMSSKCGGLYSSSLTFPATINAVISEIATTTGISISLKNLSGTGSIATAPKGLMCREVLQYIAGLLGGFLTEDSTGGIVISKYTLNDAVTVDTAFCYDFPTSNDNAYAVTGIEVTVSEEGEDDDGNVIPAVKYSQGSPINVSVGNPYMTSDLFTACASNIIGFTYMPTTVNFLGDIRLEPTDSIKVIDEDTTGINVPCMNILHTWDGGLTTVITAPGSTQTEDDSSFVGPVNQMVDRLYYDMLTAKQIIAGKVSAQYIESNYAKIDLANIADGTIKAAMIGDAQITNAKIQEISASKITSGTIDAEKIDVVNLNADNITVGKINGKQIESGTISTDNLASGAVTNEKIASGVITADKISNNAVTSDKIQLGAISERHLNVSNHLLY